MLFLNKITSRYRIEPSNTKPVLGTHKKGLFKKRRVLKIKGDGMLDYRRPVTPSSKFAFPPLYTRVKIGTVRVKRLAQEHNTVPQPGLEPGPLDPDSTALTIRPPRLPLLPVMGHFNNTATTKERLDKN